MAWPWPTWAGAKKAHRAKKPPTKKAYRAKKPTKALSAWASPWAFL